MAKRQNKFQTPKDESKVKKTTKKSKKLKSVKSTFKLGTNTKRILGLVVAMACVYLFIAFLSYLFTWKIDQDKVEGANFLDFVFTKQPFEIKNWLGKLGAIVSHRFIFNGFGFMSFLIPFYLFLVSFKISPCFLECTKDNISSIVSQCVKE